MAEGCLLLISGPVGRTGHLKIGPVHFLRSVKISLAMVN